MCLVKKISIKESHVCHGIDLLTMRMWTLSQWENELNKDYVYAFACFKNSKIVGICVSQIIFNNAEIIYLSIIPAFKRKGLGKKLLKETLKQFEDLAVEKIILEVSEKNKAAINFYHSFGFKIVNIRKNYYMDGSNAFLQEKKLLKK